MNTNELSCFVFVQPRELCTAEVWEKKWENFREVLSFSCEPASDEENRVSPM